MHFYCTYFDHRFLDRGLAMIRSLRRFEPDCRISVLCLTPATERVLARLDEPGVTLTSLEDFERENPDLLAIKAGRGLRDYYFTLSGCVVASALRHTGPDDIVTYLDADLLFYASPGPIYETMANASVGVIASRFHWWTKRLEKFGRYNVGWVSFRSDATGKQAAQWWRNSNIEWCYGYVDGDRFGDQKYLEQFFRRFPDVVEITHPGAGIGPWNVCRHSIVQGPGQAFVVDARYPLIFVHYSGVRETAPNVYLCSNVSYLAPFSETVRNGLYRPYVTLLKQIQREIGGIPTDPALELIDYGWRRRWAPVLRTVGRWAGHYVEVRTTE
jgi:hypothetical protein